MDIDQKVMNIIAQWENSTEFQDVTQWKEALMIVIAMALEDQHCKTKQSCCDAIKRCEVIYNSPNRIRRTEAMGACISVGI